MSLRGVPIHWGDEAIYIQSDCRARLLARNDYTKWKTLPMVLFIIQKIDELIFQLDCRFGSS